MLKPHRVSSSDLEHARSLSHAVAERRHVPQQAEVAAASGYVDLRAAASPPAAQGPAERGENIAAGFDPDVTVSDLPPQPVPLPVPVAPEPTEPEYDVASEPTSVSAPVAHPASEAVEPDPAAAPEAQTVSVETPGASEPIAIDAGSSSTDWLDQEIAGDEAARSESMDALEASDLLGDSQPTLPEVLELGRPAPTHVESARDDLSGLSGLGDLGGLAATDSEGQLDDDLLPTPDTDPSSLAAAIDALESTDLDSESAGLAETTAPAFSDDPTDDEGSFASSSGTIELDVFDDEEDAELDELFEGILGAEDEL